MTGPVTGYTVTLDGTHGTLPTPAASAVSAVLPGLTAGATYMGTLTANYASGSSTPVPFTFVADPATIPSGAVGQADLVRQAVGVNLHTSFGGDWNNPTSVAAAVSGIGFGWVRDRWASSANQRTVWAALHTANIGVQAIVCHVSQTTAQCATALAGLNTAAGLGQILALEGVNEPNLSGLSDWVTRARTLQQQIWNATQSGMASTYPNLQGLPVVSPSLGARRDYAALGDVSAWCTLGNVHAYPGGHPPEWWLDTLVTSASAQLNTGSKAVVLTETGPTDYNLSTTNLSTPRDVAAHHAARTIFETLTRTAYSRFAFYELLDDGGAAAGPEQHFGQVTGSATYDPAKLAVPYSAAAQYGVGAFVSSGGSYYVATVPTTGHAPPNGTYWASWSAPSMFTRKPIGNATANTLTLYADPGAAFTPAALAYTLVSPAAGLAHDLRQRRSGVWLLALWLSGPTSTVASPNNSLWTPASGGGTYRTTADITQVVTFGAARTVRTFRPSRQTASMNTDTAVTSMSVVLGREAVILEIT